MAELEDRVLVLETSIKHIDDSLTEIKNDIREVRTEIRNDFQGLNTKIDTVNSSLNAKIDGNLKWIMGAVFVSWVTTVGAIISAFFAISGGGQ